VTSRPRRRRVCGSGGGRLVAPHRFGTGAEEQQQQQRVGRGVPGGALRRRRGRRAEPRRII